MKEADKAYIAGFIDGEGCIALWSSGRPRVGRSVVRPCVFLANTNLEVLEWIREVTGLGHISRYIERRSPRHKPLYRLIFSENEIPILLEAVLPYLKVKREQAEIVLAYYKIPTSDGVENEETALLALALRDRLAKLNKRGA